MLNLFQVIGVKIYNSLYFLFVCLGINNYFKAKSHFIWQVSGLSAIPTERDLFKKIFGFALIQIKEF